MPILATMTMREPVLSPVGALIRHWRASRHLSQLDLALDAEVSARHLSFIETGRSVPSRAMILRLAEVLELPLRDRNAMLEAAGYARMFRETPLGAPEMAHIRKVLEFILERHEPFGAVALDRHWNIVMSNQALQRILAGLVDPSRVWGDGEPNLMRLTFHPHGIRPWIANWDEVGPSLVARLRREAGELNDDPKAAQILSEIMSYPGIPAAWNERDTALPPLLIPVHLRKDDLDVRLFSTITSLGTAQDITLQELRIEAFFPADEISERQLRSLAAPAGEASQND